MYCTVTWLLGTYPNILTIHTPSLFAHTFTSVVTLTPSPHLYLAGDGQTRLAEFGHARWDGPTNTRLYDNARPLLKVRWTAPEVIQSVQFTKHAEVW